ncbi:MAG: hypothetical protein H5T64_03540 [Chloroflexi bacterium]|nr:hypothetical protein [Chloroflexota bacterium]
MLFLHEGLERLREDMEVAEVGEIARRLFAMNAFDGVLTMVGVLVGSFTAHVRHPRVVLITGLATSASMGISGLWGAYLTESAERKRSLDELEEYTLTDLTATRIGQAQRLAVIIVALVDGLAPLLAALFVLSPFFAAALLGEITRMYYLSAGMAMLALFGLGMLLGSISRESLVVSGLKMVGAGLVAVMVGLLLGPAAE